MMRIIKKNTPIGLSPMNFEIHRADTSPDTYEADNRSQTQEDLPFEDAVTDRKRYAVLGTGGSTLFGIYGGQCGRLRKPPQI